MFFLFRLLLSTPVDNSGLKEFLHDNIFQGNTLAIITIFLVVPFAVSLITLCISIFNAAVQKRQVYASIFPKSRLEWIVSVRSAIVKFVEAYNEECKYDPNERSKTQAAKLEIDLHMYYHPAFLGKPNPTYTDLRDVLLEYLQAPIEQPITDHSKLVDVAQLTLNDPLVRAKVEAGVSKRQDKKVSRKTRNRNKLSWWEKFWSKANSH